MVHSKYDWKWQWVDYVLITPAAHRIHHSTAVEHYTRNLGILSIWDRLFGTYLPSKEAPLRYGVSERENFNTESVLCRNHGMLLALDRSPSHRERPRRLDAAIISLGARAALSPAALPHGVDVRGIVSFAFCRSLPDHSGDDENPDQDRDADPKERIVHLPCFFRVSREQSSLPRRAVRIILSWKDGRFLRFLTRDVAPGFHGAESGWNARWITFP